MEKNNFDKRKEYVNKINELTTIVGDQIYYENSIFLINLRKILEGIIALFAEEKEDYIFYDFNHEKKNEEIKKYIKKNENIPFVSNYFKLTSELSMYAHFNIGSDSNKQKLTFNDIKKKVNKINDLINEITKDKKEIKKISLNNEIIENKENDKKYIWLKENVETLNERKFIDIINNTYIIPIFQREYKWKIDQIISFIDDININENKYYDIGIFYVTDKNNTIVDGQQRLITINIILNLLKIFFNKFINNEKELLNSYFKIKRERIGKTWKNDIDKLNEYLKNANNENNNFYDIYFKIKNLLHNENNNFITKLKKVKVNFKKIREKDAVFYFNKVNNEGIKLTSFENFITQLLYFEKKNEKELEEIYDVYDKYDEINDKNIKLVINKLTWLILKRQNLKKDTKIKFINLISNSGYILNDCIYLQNYKVNNTINSIDLNDNDYSIILNEIMIDIYLKDIEKNTLKLLVIKIISIIEKKELSYDEDQQNFKNIWSIWKNEFTSKNKWIINSKISIYFKKMFVILSKNITFPDFNIEQTKLFLFLNTNYKNDLKITKNEYEFINEIKNNNDGFLKLNNDLLFVNNFSNSNLISNRPEQINIINLNIGIFLINTLKWIILNPNIFIQSTSLNERKKIIIKIIQENIKNLDWKMKYRNDINFKNMIDNYYRTYKNNKLNPQIFILHLDPSFRLKLIGEQLYSFNEDKNGNISLLDPYIMFLNIMDSNDILELNDLTYNLIINN